MKVYVISFNVMDIKISFVKFQFKGYLTMTSMKGRVAFIKFVDLFKSQI